MDLSERQGNVLLYRQYYSGDKGFGIGNYVIDRLASMAFAQGYIWMSEADDPEFPTYEWGVELGTAGDLFLLITVDNEGNPKTEALPAEGTDVIVSETNVVIGYGHEWTFQKTGKWFKARIEYYDEETWIYDPVPVMIGRTTYRFDKYVIEPNGLGVNPVVHVKNTPLVNDFYGQSDISAPITAVETAEDQLLTAKHVNKYMSQPKRWYKGTALEQGQARDLYQFDSAGVITTDSETEIKLLTWDNNLKATFELLEKSIKITEDVAGVVNVPSDKEYSGRALAILNRPMIDVSNRKRKEMDRGLHSVIERFQIIQDEAIVFELTWPSYFSLTSKEKTERLDLLQTLKDSGVITESEFTEEARKLI